VVSKSLPSDTVCAGSPARVLCSLDEYLDRHRQRIAESETFDYAQYDIGVIDEVGRRRMIAAVSQGDAYMLGGRSAELRGVGGTLRTPGVGAPELVRKVGPSSVDSSAGSSRE
jgi:hypothetical protein